MSHPDSKEPDLQEPAPATGPVRADAGRSESRAWRTLREFTIIVAGVLVALAAQAWWETRQERARERDYLRQLLADTRENERRLEAAIAEDSATGLAIGQLADALTGARPLPPSDSMRRWTVRVGASAEFQPVGGTYQALLGTGDLRLIRTDSLRARLVAYGSRLETDHEMLLVMLQLGLANIDMLPRKFPFMRRLFLDGPGAAGAPAFDFAPLRGDPDVTSLLFRLQAANVNRLNRLRRILDDTRRVRHALEAERGLDPAPEAEEPER